MIPQIFEYFKRDLYTNEKRPEHNRKATQLTLNRFSWYHKYLNMSKETCTHTKRDLYTIGKRLAIVSGGTTNIAACQKSPEKIPKETCHTYEKRLEICIHTKRDSYDSQLCLRVLQMLKDVKRALYKYEKRPVELRKEPCINTKRDLYTIGKRLYWLSTVSQDTTNIWICQKGPVQKRKETWTQSESDSIDSQPFLMIPQIFECQKRPVHIWKETCTQSERDSTDSQSCLKVLQILNHVKRALYKYEEKPVHIQKETRLTLHRVPRYYKCWSMSKEPCTNMKRDLYTIGKQLNWLSIVPQGTTHVEICQKRPVPARKKTQLTLNHVWRYYEYSNILNEPCTHTKRDLNTIRKRLYWLSIVSQSTTNMPCMSEETCTHAKRDLYIYEKRLVYIWKEVNLKVPHIYWKRSLYTHQKRPVHTRQETCT